jgi:hypothetical protein
MAQAGFTCCDVFTICGHGCFSLIYLSRAFLPVRFRFIFFHFLLCGIAGQNLLSQPLLPGNYLFFFIDMGSGK